MKINLEHIVKLANLIVAKGEKEKFEKQLTDILSYVEKLKEVGTNNIEPTSQVTGLENVTREDDAKPLLSQEEVLKNAKSVHNGFFKVKAILNE